MIPFATNFTLLDFYVSDNDGLYALFTVVAVGFAIVLIVTVIRQSRASDRHAPSTRHAATSTPEEALTNADETAQ